MTQELMNKLSKAITAYDNYKESRDPSLEEPRRAHALFAEMQSLANRVAGAAVEEGNPYMFERSIEAEMVYEYHTGRAFVPMEDANPLYDDAIYALSQGRAIPEEDAEFIRRIEVEKKRISSELWHSRTQNRLWSGLTAAKDVAKYAASLIGGTDVKPGASDATLQQRIVKALVRRGVGQAAYDLAMARWLDDCQEAEDRGWEVPSEHEGEKQARIFAAVEVQKILAYLGGYRLQPNLEKLAKRYW